MPLAINSLGGGHTHSHACIYTHVHMHTYAHINTHTYTHTDDPHRINFKKPGAHRPQANACLV